MLLSQPSPKPPDTFESRLDIVRREPNRYTAGLNGLRFQRDVFEIGKSAGVGHIVLAPEPAHDVYQLFAHLHPRAGRESQDLKLMFLCRVFGSTVTHAKIDAAAGDPVQAAELIRQ